MNINLQEIFSVHEIQSGNMLDQQKTGGCVSQGIFIFVETLTGSNLTVKNSVHSSPPCHNYTQVASSVWKPLHWYLSSIYLLYYKLNFTALRPELKAVFVHVKLNVISHWTKIQRIFWMSSDCLFWKSGTGPLTSQTVSFDDVFSWHLPASQCLTSTGCHVKMLKLCMFYFWCPVDGWNWLTFKKQWLMKQLTSLPWSRMCK